jgi:hypothetical protein
MTDPPPQGSTGAAPAIGRNDKMWAKAGLPIFGFLVVLVEMDLYNQKGL